MLASEFRVLVSAVAVLLGASFASAAVVETIYDEPFNNPTAGDVFLHQNPGTTAWTGHWWEDDGAAGTDDDHLESFEQFTGAPSSYSSPGANRRAPVILSSDLVFFINDPSYAAGDAVILWRAIDLGLAGNLYAINFSEGCNATDENLRIAIQAGGQWYASDAVYNPSATNVQTQHSLLMASAAWRTLNFGTEGTGMLSLGGAASVPGSAAVTAVGLFDESMSNRYRIYDLSVQAIPEPATAMLLLAGAGLIARRRRARA